MTSYQVALETMQTRMFNPSADAMNAFSRSGYKPSFEAYYSRLVPAFDAIEELYKTVGDPDQMLRNMAEAAVSHAASILENIKGKNQREKMRMNLDMQMAVFVYPSILHYKGESSKKLVEVLSAAYKETFPKSNVTPAEMEYIEKGFHRKFCYITTAVCQSLGKSDDCYELNLLRTYRDEYLMTHEGGEAKIDEYYDVAPSIIKHINEREEAGEIYREIYDSYVAPCIGMIESDDKDACMEHYIRMVDELKNRYFLTQMPS